MSQQINLYDPALLRKRDWLAFNNVAALSAVLLLVVAGWGSWARMQLKALEAESQLLEPQVKALQEQVTAIGKLIAERKPDPKLAADLAFAQRVLTARSDVVAALQKGVGAESVSFAEYLRGFARQTPAGLWLTAVVIGDGGGALEIRGRMTEAAVLPDYIRRLNSEKAFQGKTFAALQVSSGKAEGAATGKPDAAPARAPYLEFALVPAGGGTISPSAAGNAQSNPTPVTEQKFADAGSVAREVVR